MKNVILIVCISTLLAACGGQTSDPKIPTTFTPAAPNTPNNSEDNTKVGVFIDAPVKGLAYTSAPSGKKGTTNEKGEFEYIDDDTVSFNMGSIELGSATPDKTNKVKVTQLDQALLIAQLLQVLDNDVNEDRIDVSDIVIPETVKKAIVDRLQDKDGDANTADIITEDQLFSIKKVNPKKLTLKQKDKVVTKDKVLEHVKQQLGKSGLRFTASELKNLFLIDVGLLKKFEGDNLAFSASNSIKQINVEKNRAEMSDASWELDAKGNLAISFKRDNCTISKLNEDVDSIDISWFCADKEKPKNIRKGLKYFVKPQPLSANDLSGKSFNFTSLSKESESLTFRNDGTLNCNGEKSSCPYKDHPSYKNAVWIEGGGDSGEEGALMILAQGSLAKGKFVMIHYKDDGNTLDAVEVMKVSGNTLKQVFEIDSLEGSSANGITSGNIVFANNVPDNAYIRITPSKFQQGGNTSPNYGDSLRCKVQSNGNWGNKDCWISEYGKNNDEFKPGNKFHFVVFVNTNQDKHFNPNDASICFSGNDAPWNSWSSVECSNHSPLINDGDYDSNDNPNAGTQNPNYSPFTQEMISGKTFYNVYTDWDDQDKDNSTTDWVASTFTFDNSGEGRAVFGLHDSNTAPDVTFNYSIDAKGYLILSNWAFTNPEDAPDDHQDSDIDLIGLIEDNGDSFKVCWRDSLDELNKGCDGNERFYTIKADAKAALEAPETAYSEHEDDPYAIQNPNYSPFTEKIVAGKTFYVPGVEKDDNFTVFFGANKKGKLWFSLAENTTPPDINFDYHIDAEGYVVFFNVKAKGVNSEYAPAMGLLGENNHALIVCWSNYSLNDIRDVCENDDKMIIYKTKDAAQAEIRADDEYFDGHSDYVDNPNLGSKNPTYIPFTQEMISGKTIFSSAGITYQFDPSGWGEYQRGYHDNITSPSATFDWRLDDQGYLIFSNLVVDGGALEGQEEIYGLFMKDTTFLELCVATSTESLENECTVEVWLYNKEDAEELFKD